MKKLSPFRWFVLQNFPFIEADFDALTNYELMCKIVEYLNDTITKTNELGNQVEVLTNWFNNLDVQDEIDHKLDEMVEDGTLQRIIGEFLNVTKNVKMYGAVGDGTTDDTEALVNAINDLNDGETLFFPAGDYIVYSDYENNTNNPSYNLERLIRLVGKKHICLMGESKATTRIRPPYQGRSGTKYYYPCTLTIQECEDVEIKGLTIESKGENYGSHDDMISVTAGTQRALAMAVNGGSAVFVCLSKNVEVHDCNIRLAGSCGSLYFSSISDCYVHDCFLNVASLGYACVAFDNFVGSGSSFNEIGIVRNINCYAETLLQPENNEVQIGSNVYCAKAGVTIEGSVTNTFSIDVEDSYFADMYSGGTSSSGHNNGEGVVLYYATGRIKGNKIERCNIGIRNMQLNQDGKVYPCLIQGNEIHARYTGIWLYHTGAGGGSSKIDIIDNIIDVDETTTVPDGAPDILKQKSAIGCSGFNTYISTILNNIITAKHFIYCLNRIGTMKILNNSIKSNIGIYATGGGRFLIKNNDFEISENGIYLYPYDGSSVFDLYYTIDDNNFKASEALSNVVQTRAGNYSSQLHQESFQNNKFQNCFCLYQRLTYNDKKINIATITARNLQGSNTLLTFKIENGYLGYRNYKVIDDNNTIVNSTSISSYDETNGTLTLLFTGDIRSRFTTNNSYILL